eukprot:TRINITY_DN5808_c0_g1_i4.p1 TRINITY_DN5808_c0_g1~~TRINITY_DN5808_c0_g1_i4.p1  ORF type:complete len:519 (+),score=125.85 TRINITY_DN5808_c0_g1_i4:47-1558(+)
MIVACFVAMHCAVGLTHDLTQAYFSKTYNGTTYALSTSGVEVLPDMSYLGLIPPEGVVDLTVADDFLYLLGRDANWEMLRIYSLGEEGTMPQKVGSYTGGGWGFVETVAVVVRGDSAIVATKDQVRMIDLGVRQQTVVTDSFAVNGCRAMVLTGNVLAVVEDGLIRLLDIDDLQQMGTILTHGSAVVSAADAAQLFIADESGSVRGYHVGSDTVINFSFTPPLEVTIKPTALAYSAKESAVYFAYSQTPCSVYGCGCVWRFDVATHEWRILYTSVGDVQSVDAVNGTHVLICSLSEGCALRDQRMFRAHYDGDKLVAQHPPAAKDDRKPFVEEHPKEVAGSAALLLTISFFVYLRALIKKNNARVDEAREARAPTREVDEGTEKQEPTSPYAPLPPQPYGEDMPAPEHMVCPISLEIMIDPVRCVDKYHNFERYHIERFVKNVKGECPVSRQAMSVQDLEANGELKAEILQWVAEYRKGKGTQDNVSSTTASESDRDEAEDMV